MERRQILIAAGTISAVGLAGCLGGDDDDLVEADADEILLSVDEISETLTDDWNEGVFIGEEGITRPAGVDTLSFVELLDEGQNEVISVIVRVFESIEDAEVYVDDELDTTGDFEVREEDVGDEAHSVYNPELEITSFFARQANATVSAIGTVHVSNLREIAEMQIDELP